MGSTVFRTLGSRSGGIAYEIRSANQVESVALTCSEANQVLAIAPALLTAHAIAENRYGARGLVWPDQQLAGEDLWGYLEGAGVQIRHY